MSFWATNTSAGGVNVNDRQWGANVIAPCGATSRTEAVRLDFVLAHQRKERTTILFRLDRGVSNIPTARSKDLLDVSSFELLDHARFCRSERFVMTLTYVRTAQRRHPRHRASSHWPRSERASARAVIHAHCLATCGRAASWWPMATARVNTARFLRHLPQEVRSECKDVVLTIA